MDKLRLRFQKTGKAVYISHLDLMRVVQRIFLRAGTPIKYSEGFNPHALISICLPLSVGMASDCELMVSASRAKLNSPPCRRRQRRLARGRALSGRLRAGAQGGADKVAARPLRVRV